MKTFKSMLRESGNGITFEFTIPKNIVEWEKLEVGKTYELALIEEEMNK